MLHHRWPTPVNRSPLIALVPILAGVLAPSAAPADPPDARSAIVADADSLAAPGIPGPLVLLDGSAFPIAVGRQGRSVSLPVVAGARAGRGRVVAFGHTGYLDGAALGVGDTALLVERCVRWSGGDRASPRVGVPHDAGLAEALGVRGLDARVLPADWSARLAGVDVLCLQTHRLRDGDLEPVRAFIRNGGGVLASGLGWGWLQLNPTKAIREHPGNRLLVWAGIGWADGTLERTRGEGYALDAAIPSISRVDQALGLIESPDGKAASREEGAQAGAIAGAAIRVLPEGHALFDRLRRLLDGGVARRAPSTGAPVRVGEARERVLLALEVELEHRTPPEEVRAHPAAAVFPGPVPPEAPRVGRTIAIDAGVRGWRGTGLYAPPGGLVTVTLGDGVDPGGARVRIGCHTDRLWHLDDWRRAPDIARDFPLGTGTTRVASAFGGLIYIEPTARTGAIEVTIDGGVEAPRFVLGSTTPEQWAASRLAPAPWGEIETAKIIVSVPAESLRALDDPTAVLEMWDRISDAHSTLGQTPLARERPERFVADEQISAGYMHAGYPIMTHLDAVDEMTEVGRLRAGPWGLLHELGHNHQEGEWTFAGTGEVTCNLFALHAIDTACTPAEGSRGHGAVDQPPSVEKHLADGARFEAWQRDPFLALHMYVQLQREFGWETFKRVFAEYRALPAGDRPRTDADKRDQWLVRFSRACGRNLGPFFQAWGVPTGDGARRSIADLPEWMPADMPRP
ncbi:MAG: hypothetical protein FJ255_05375 [Phycisphaerae bacterium]|nr:hypothetical protein [Phycisphaerae bacterium]